MNERLYLYFIENGHYKEVIDSSDNIEQLQGAAKLFLQGRYGKTDTWAYENSFQLVHPNSPHGIGGGHAVDTVISSHPDLHR